MSSETNIQAFIEEQRRLLKMEMEQFTINQQDSVGIDLDRGRGVCRKSASPSVAGDDVPTAIVAAYDDEDDSTRARLCGGVELREDGRQTEIQNDPLVEPLHLSCDGRCLDKEKQAFLAETLENPLTFTRSNARHTPVRCSPSGRPGDKTSPAGLGSHSGTARMLRRGPGEYGPSKSTTHLAFGIGDIVKQQQQKKTTITTATHNLGGGFGGLGDIVKQTQNKQQKQRQDLNLNLNNVNKPKHNRHVHYNSNVIGGSGFVDETIYDYGSNAAGYSATSKSNLNKRNERIKNSGKRVFIDSRVVEVGNNKSVQTDIKNIRNNLIQEDNSPASYVLNDTAITNNNQFPVRRRGFITHSTRPAHSPPRNINLNINNNIADSGPPPIFFHDESSDYELTDVDNAPAHNANDDSDDTSDNCNKRRSCSGYCACASTDCVMHHNSRSPILHRLDRSSGVGTSSGTTSRLSHMDKPRSILSNRYYTSATSPRERLLSDLKHTYVPSVYDGFSFSDRTEEYERERVKKELYQNELRLQIEEKRRQATMRENQERVEQELENRRLEQQLLRMHEEELRDEERRTLRRNSEDLHRRAHEIGTRATYQRRHTDSESSLHKMPSPYSPPMTRRNMQHNMAAAGATGAASVFDTSPVTSRYNASALRNRMDSLSDSYGTYNTYGGGRSTIDGASVFNRYDSLSRIDALKQQQHTALSRLDNLTLNDPYSNRIQRRHSATHQELSGSRRSPKLQRRSSSSRFDTDSLPIPLLKAASHSPVARDLRNATAINSNKYSVSESLRRLEEKWQIPAVQKNIMSYDVYPDGHNRSILTQLGSMRMQLQQEQLRMDEALRRRGFSSQYKAVNFH